MPTKTNLKLSRTYQAVSAHLWQTLSATILYYKLNNIWKQIFAANINSDHNIWTSTVNVSGNFFSKPSIFIIKQKIMQLKVKLSIFREDTFKV